VYLSPPLVSAALVAALIPERPFRSRRGKSVEDLPLKGGLFAEYRVTVQGGTHSHSSQCATICDAEHPAGNMPPLDFRAAASHPL